MVKVGFYTTDLDHSTLDSGLVNHPQDKGHEVHNETVKDGDKAHLDAASKDVGRDIIGIALEKIGHLQIAKQGSENAYRKGCQADFLYPCRGLPCGEEQGDEKDGYHNHPGRTAGNEESEKIC